MSSCDAYIFCIAQRTRKFVDHTSVMVMVMVVVRIMVMVMVILLLQGSYRFLWITISNSPPYG